MEIDTPLLVFLGVGMVVATFVDVVWTAIAVGARRGPLSDVVARTVAAAGQVGRAGHRRRSSVGVATAAAVPIAWLLLLWCGFALLFLSDDDAVVVASSQQPTSALGRIAYAAGGLAGAGAGLEAGTEAWQLVNNVAALAGLALVTLSLTYVMQVVSSVVSERSTMSEVAAVGARPGEAAATGPGTSGPLSVLVLLIADGISTAAQRHLAFPMLQYFHSDSSSTAASVNLARFAVLLDDLERIDPDGHATVVRVGRAAIDGFLDTLRLHATVDDTDRAGRVEAFLVQEGWTWEDVTA